MLGARCWTFAALALLPLTACVLFDGPSDYPPRDAGGQDVDPTADAASGLDATSTGDSGGLDAAVPVADAHPDGAGPDDPSIDARPDSACTASGGACTTNSACCSGTCLVAELKCK